MFFGFRGRIRLPVAYGVEMRTGTLLFDERYLQLQGDGTILYDKQPGQNQIFDVYNDQYGGDCYVRAPNGRWVHIYHWGNNVYQCGTTPYLQSATRFSFQYGSGYQKPEDGFRVRVPALNCWIAGMALPSVPPGPGFLVTDQLELIWTPEFVLPPLLKGRSYRGMDYSGLDFRTFLFFALTLDGIKLDRANLQGTHTWGLRMAEASLVRANLAQMKAARVNCARSDLTGACLAGADLAGANLQGTALGESDLTGANLRGADLTGAVLKGAQMKGADLRGAVLSKANLEGNDLSGVLVDGSTRLDGAVLKGCNLSGLNLAGIDLSGATLEKARLARTDLRRTNLVGTNLSETDLTETLFDDEPRFSRDATRRTLLRKASVPFAAIRRNWTCLDLTDAKIPDLPQNLSDDKQTLQARAAILRGLQLDRRVIASAEFVDADLQGANFSKSQLDYSTFEGAMLGGDRSVPAAIFSGASLAFVNLNKANLAGADFSYTAMQDSTAVRATMPQVKFNGAFLHKVDFSNVADMRGANFAHACVLNCVLRGCSITPFDGAGASFAKACLQGSDFEGATLFGANLNDAAVAPAAGSLKVKVRLGEECIELELPYGPTVLPEAVTNPQTSCPSGAGGPCTGEKLRSPDAPMTHWISPLCAGETPTVSPATPEPLEVTR